MSLQQYLYQTFKFSRKLRQNDYSIFVVQDIKDILYGEGPNVFGAAFGTDRAYRHFTVDMAIPAFDLLADEILFYLSNKKVETVKSFDEWHHKTCEMFLNKLNQTITETNYPEQKLYGKAQKVLNVAMKYLYCCNDANSVSEYKKFDYCHIALDGYTYYGTYPLSFYRDVIYPYIYRKPSPKLTLWSNISNYREYDTIIKNTRNFFDAHPHTFNEYLRACNADGLFVDVHSIAATDDRVLTPFEAEFFIWAICKSNKRIALAELFKPIVSYTCLSITCDTPVDQLAVKEYLASITPFDEIDGNLIYMTLETEDIIPTPTLLKDVICLLEEHQDKLASANEKFNCTLELVAKSPIPCTLEECTQDTLSFAKYIGATITIL